MGKVVKVANVCICIFHPEVVYLIMQMLTNACFLITTVMKMLLVIIPTEAIYVDAMKDIMAMVIPALVS